VGSLGMLPQCYVCMQPTRAECNRSVFAGAKQAACAFAVQLSSWHLNNISSLVGRSLAQDVELACLAACARLCMQCSCGAGTKAWIAPAPCAI